MSVTLHTNLGDMKLELCCKETPVAAENFLKLAACNYYDGTLFLRNIAGFAIQGGDPTGTGKGGESIFGTPIEEEFHPNLRHDRRGVVAMANNGPNTSNSQFYITYTSQPHLDNVYTVFGQITDGLEVLDSMERVPVASKKYRPLEDIVLQRITIHANPLAN